MSENQKNIVRRGKVTDGLAVKNPLLVNGLVIAPAVLYGNTLQNALMLSGYISLLTFAVLLICSFIPRTIVYASRIILYTIISAAVFVPVYMIFEKIAPELLADMGIFAYLLIINPFITARSEVQFFREKKGRMILDIIFTLTGYSAAVIILGFIRELISTGGLNGELYGIKYTVAGFGLPFGGFILIGLAAAFLRHIINIVRSYKENS